MNVAVSDEFLEERWFERARDWQEEFVFLAEFGGGFKDGWQVHRDFFAAAAWHERDPGLDVVECLLSGIVHAGNFRRGQVGKGMSNKRSIHAVDAVEVLFKRKDH